MKNKFIKILSNFIPFKPLRKNFKTRFLSSIKSDKGQNNQLILLDDNGNKTNSKYLKNLEINFNGDNSTVIMYQSTNIVKKLTFNLSGNNSIKIGKTLSPFEIGLPGGLFSNGCELEIGDNATFFGPVIFMHNESNLKVKIGSDCMFARNSFIMPSDCHTLFDPDTKEILNPPKNIEICDHVWLTHDVKILKGAVVPKNSIVTASSVFTSSTSKQIPSPPFLSKGGYIFSGIPARIIRTDINWSKENTEEYARNDGRGGGLVTMMGGLW